MRPTGSRYLLALPWAALALLFAVIESTASAQPAYTIFPLHPAAPFDYEVPNGISRVGHIVGYAVIDSTSEFHAFVQRDSTWTDTRYHLGMRLVRVQAFSPAYFALVTAVPDLRSAFAIGEHVIVAGRQVAVEVTPSGVGQLSDSDVAAVQAAW